MSPEAAPRWPVRLAFAAVGTAHVLNALMILARPSHPSDRILETVFQSVVIVPVAGLAAFALTLDLLRRDARSAAWAGVGLALSVAPSVVLFAFAREFVGSGALNAAVGLVFISLVVLAFAAPLAALVAARAPRWLLAGAALFSLLVLALDGLSLVVDVASRGGGEAWPSFRSAGTGYRAAIAAGEIALAGMLFLAAARPDASALPPSRPRSAWVFGVALLAVSWLFGGYAIGVVPIWWIPVVALVSSPMLRWREAPARAGAAVVLLLLALVPAWPVVVTETTDVANASIPPRQERVSLADVAGHGPLWQVSGGFGGRTVDVPPWILAMSVAWALALVALTAAPSRRPGPPRAP